MKEARGGIKGEVGMTKTIKEVALELYPIKKKLSKNGKAEYDQNQPRRKAFMRGHQMALETFFKINKEIRNRFMENSGIGVKRGSANTLPEIDVSLSNVSHRDSEAFGILRINDSAIPSDNVSTVDILHIIFSMQSTGHNNTSFLHLASHYFPMAGLSHLTRVQLKTRSCWTPGLFFSLREEDGGDGQSPEGVLYEPLDCAAKVRYKKEKCYFR